MIIKLRKVIMALFLISVLIGNYKEIEQMVYELYGFTEEEIKIEEGGL